MAVLNTKDIEKMSEEERMKKIKELKMELIKAKVGAAKAGTSKIKQIKRTISRIFTVKPKVEKLNKTEKTVKEKNKRGDMSKVRVA